MNGSKQVLTFCLLLLMPIGVLAGEGAQTDTKTHHLIEVGSLEAESENHINPEQAARIKYSTQRFVYLDPGETLTFQFRDRTERQIRLVSVQEEKDPVIGLTRRAQVQVEVGGKPMGLSCAPYVMPTETAGLRIQADTTSAWLAIPKRVQFSLWDAADPIVDTNLFCFPLPGYRLFSHGVQAYNEPVNFRVWPQGRNMEPIQIDFGDGALVKNYCSYSAITHRFTAPGIQVVTVRGKAGALPVAQKVKVRVRE